MAKKTVIITQAGETIDAHEDWLYGINVKRIRYKTVPDKFDIEISARKRVLLSDNSFSYDSKDEIIILDYNRVPNKLNLDVRLDQAYSTFQSLLTAIEKGDNVWDAREQK